MLNLGPLAFAAPWLLVALTLLPVIWWLLRVTPPAPRRVAFPPLRLLFGIDPKETRPMWREALGHIVDCWTKDEVEFQGKYWSLPKRRVLPKPLQQPHPPIWGATTSLEGHTEMGRLGIGLCSFAVGLPPEAFKEKVDAYRAGIAQCKQPVGKFMNDQAATFTMVHCADSNERAFSEAAESMVWYPIVGAKQIAAVADWQAGKDLGNYAYAGDMKQARDSGGLDQMNFVVEAADAACAEVTFVEATSSEELSRVLVPVQIFRAELAPARDALADAEKYL